jgi:hypothetical protein
MRIGSALLVLILLSVAPGAVHAQGIDCPDVDFSTEVGSRVITLRWQDPPLEARTEVDLSLRKISDFLPMDDSLSWRGTALPTISGSFTGRCDFLYKFTSETNDTIDTMSPGFASADVARVSEGWSGTSMPISGGSPPTCTGDSTFVFTVAQAGIIDAVAGTAARLTWRQDAVRSGTLDIPASYTPRELIDVSNGLEVAFTPGTLVEGEMFSIAIIPPAPSGGVQIRWERYKLPNTAVIDDSSLTGTPGFGSLSFCRPDTALEFDQGLALSLSPGSVFETEFDGDSLGVFRVRALSYDGFRIRRTDISNLNADSMTVLREYFRCRDEDGFFFEGPERVYEDVEVHNGFPYQYAVTCFDTLSHTESAIRRTESLYPRTPPGNDPNQIQVVPNPYKRRVSWEQEGEAKVQFVNVPVGTFLRIYTAAGNLVREIPAEEVTLGCSASGLSGCINWNLRNGQGEEIVSGVYIFQAEAPGGKTHVGKFMVAR